MSEFDKLKDEGEQYAKDHPQQVKEGEAAAEKKIGIGQQCDAEPDDGQRGPQDKADDGG
jgi:hypothetical protein